MKRVIMLAVCMLMLAPNFGLANANQEYAAFTSIGYGPLEGEIVNPGAIGTDDMGRIYVIDRASRKGLIYLGNGSYVKTIAVPQTVNLEKLSPNISANTGMVAYASGKSVTLASSDGEVSAVCGLGSGNLISHPLKVKLLNDLSVLILDGVTGLIKYDRSGNLIGQKVLPGSIPTAPVINSFDVSPTGDVVLLSITMDMPKEEEGAPEPNRLSVVQFTFLDTDFKVKSSFKLATTESYNPKSGEVSFVDAKKIAFMSTDLSGFIELDTSGSVLSEVFKGAPISYKSFAPSGNNYFVFNNNEFLMLSKNGKDVKTLAKFSNDPMKFGLIDQISQNADGFAVLDNKRSDIQFFTSKGFAAAREVTAGTNTVLFSNSSGNACLYMPGTKTVRVLGSSGSQNATFQFEQQIEGLNRIVKGFGEDFLGLSNEYGLVYRISKEGFFILKFGSFGREQGQFTNPVDLFAAPDKTIHVLDADGMVKVFDGNGKFLRSYGLPKDQTPMKDPEGIAILPSFDVMVSDSGNDRIIVFGQDGSFKYAMGKTSPSRIKRTVGDYAQDIGTFNHPGQISVSGENIFVLDRGNIRIQIIRKEKVVPKISVDKKTIDFGSVKDGVLSDKITIKNTGNGVLEGSAICDAGWIELSKKTVVGNETVIEIRCIADMVPFWNEKPAEIVINTNGGSAKVVVTATRTGKKIRLQVNSLKAYIDDREIEMTVPPTLVGNNTMVPLRFVGEALNAAVDWNGDEKKVTYVLGSKTVIVWIGKKDALVDGQTVTMSAAPVIVKNKTLVPLRFVSEALGASVEWLGETKTIIICYPPKQ